MMDVYMCMLFVNRLTYYFSFLFFFIGNMKVIHLFFVQNN
jgi:hypothetical protein